MADKTRDHRRQPARGTRDTEQDTADLLNTLIRNNNHLLWGAQLAFKNAGDNMAGARNIMLQGLLQTQGPIGG